MMRHKRKAAGSAAWKTLIALLIGCAAWAGAHAADMLPLPSDKPSAPAAHAEAGGEAGRGADHAAGNGAPGDGSGMVNAVGGTDGDGSGMDGIGSGADTPGGKADNRAGSGTEGDGGRAAAAGMEGVPDGQAAGPSAAGWRRLASAQAPEGASIVKEGVAFRIDLPADGMFSYQLWRRREGTDGVLNDDAFASLILEAALRAGLEAGERHIHDALPAGVRAGFDADVSEGRDLTLRNPHAFPAALLITASGGTLTAEWIGDAPADWTAPAVTVSEPQIFRPERIELIGADRSHTGESPGRPGMLVKVYADGRLLHKDFYAPVPARIVRAPGEEERSAFVHDGSLNGP